MDTQTENLLLKRFSSDLFIKIKKNRWKPYQKSSTHLTV